ncbi:MAG TPA: arsenate reductase ArsC [Thermoanaerobaculia bacterium]
MPYKVLFLCTGNSARSILSEYFLRKADPRRFESFSAGSDPKGEVNPLALRLLREVYQIDASDARSKSWEEFKGVRFDFVITVCDNAKESCPVFPGQPIAAHWGVPDPIGYDDFKEAGRVLARRVELFVNLPIEKLDRLRLEELAREIGETAAYPNRPVM